MFAIIAIFGYVGAHLHLKPAYGTSIDEELDNAVKQYSVRPNPQTKRLELTVDGQAYDPTVYTPGPLGIGELPAAKGLLIETAYALDTYNDKLESAIGDLLGRFQTTTAYPDYVVAGLSDLAPATYDDAIQPDERTYRLRIKSPTHKNLLNRPPDEVTARLLIAAIRGGIAEAIVLSPPPRNATLDEVEDVLRPVLLKRAALQAGNEVCQRLFDIGANLRRFLRGPEPDQDSGDGDCTWAHAYPEPADGQLGKDETKAVCVSEGCFHYRLKRIASEGIGFFWTIGSFRWLELVLLTMLGVLVRRLIDFGISFARLRSLDRDPEPTDDAAQTVPWEPRETLRVLMSLLYTPVLAIAVIWVLTATELISAGSVDDWTSHALLPIAFLLGLFPDLGHLVLTRVAQAVFGEIRGTQPLPRKPRQIEGPKQTQPSGPNDESPPSLDSLRLRLRFIYTSPFR